MGYYDDDDPPEHATDEDECDCDECEAAVSFDKAVTAPSPTEARRLMIEDRVRKLTPEARAIAEENIDRAYELFDVQEAYRNRNLEQSKVELDEVDLTKPDYTHLFDTEPMGEIAAVHMPDGTEKYFESVENISAEELSTRIAEADAQMDAMQEALDELRAEKDRRSKIGKARPHPDGLQPVPFPSSAEMIEHSILESDTILAQQPDFIRAAVDHFRTVREPPRHPTKFSDEEIAQLRAEVERELRSITDDEPAPDNVIHLTKYDQPSPVHNDEEPVWPQVIEELFDLEIPVPAIVVEALAYDMEERAAVGFKRYGTHLQPHNGRDALADAYAEALDEVVYLKQAVIEAESEIETQELDELYVEAVHHAAKILQIMSIRTGLRKE
jgi:hypothetical protein